ncbi:hypothetical protein Xvie_02672 [Xenorhabdus vietnamensis]|uniref:Big-1 domain-containing protein n=1 Tax=Xenorhabdus vietnamensis TaxID=351656 RepID=A0A1Y2SDJ1_9GAMM|nr:inverse autotransporter beta domain-containing protein [Xenorhabdus vietnamensis]OTA15590.1 hypothetical protein Xvie_02672 [Xenorhabdus vietnamensis]
MSSYMIIIRFLIFFYILFLPSSIISAFADGNDKTNKIYMRNSEGKNNIDIRVNQLSNETVNKNANDISESDTPGLIARNIQTVGNILLSSPSDLAEQAKSYALGKFNSTISSETQKWLSQFGTARINFGLDKKGTLENNSLDLLLPLYDNKIDWLIFSQLGYRNKDSRNTINVGLGGRYFYQSWMYGLNTFYDHDLTGKNQRLGLGGEMWGDYIKLSANIYYRLSGLQESRNFKYYHERPANGYDINGEFFLPAYPNLGAKLTYEQYFGDNVTLFNRDTRQKNPSLAKLGLTYTPIPLVTMGVDYKQGESGHTETQFLANFNYKLGVPLSTQLSPENVAAMRTLAGSRYDLVERNNNIVLDHIKQSITQLSIPPTLMGYSHEEKTIPATNNPNNKIEEQKNEGFAKFIKDGGKLDVKGNKISITFPIYQLSTGKSNNYPISFNIFENSNTKTVSHHETVTLIVRPFVVKEKEVNPTETLPADGKKAYLFTPVITSDTVGNQPLAQVTLDNVQWTTEPEIGEQSGLQWGKPEKTSKTNDKGQLQAALTSSKPIKDVKVFLQMDGMPKTQVGTVSFGEDTSRFYVDKIKISLPNNMTAPLTADGTQAYTYKAVVLDGSNNPVPPNTLITNVKWDHDHKEISTLKLVSNGDKTDGEGQLTATLTSSEPVDNVTVTLSIEEHQKKSANPVLFKPAKISLSIDPHQKIITVHQTYTLTAVIKDINNKPEANKKVNWALKNPNQEGVTISSTSSTTGNNGQATTTLTSTKANKITVVASVDEVSVQGTNTVDVEFQWPKIQKPILKSGQKSGTVSPNGTDHYSFIAEVSNLDGTPYTKADLIWSPSYPQGTDKNKTWLKDQVVGQPDGKATVQLVSNQKNPVVKGAQACLAIVNEPSTEQCSEPVNFASPQVEYEIASVEVYRVEISGKDENFDPQHPLFGDGKSLYKYRAKIVDKQKKDAIINHQFSDVTWARDHSNIDDSEVPPLEWDKENKTDGRGYLYATLKSYVGIDNIKVTLNMTGLHGSKLFQDANKKVSFEPTPEPVALMVYRFDRTTNQPDKSASQLFKEQNRPYNVFTDNLIAELRSITGEELVKPGDTPSYNVKKIGGKWDPVTIDNNTGLITFQAPGQARITINVKKNNGTKRKYTYITYPRRLFSYSPGYTFTYPMNDEHNCENLKYDGETGHSPTVSQLVSSGTGTALSDDFPNSYKFGILDDIGPISKTSSYIKMLRSRNELGKYFVYDTATGREVPLISDGNTLQAFVICIVE